MTTNNSTLKYDKIATCKICSKEIGYLAKDKTYPSGITTAKGWWHTGKDEWIDHKARP